MHERGATSNLNDLRAGALAGARALDLGGCGLTEFPSEIFGLAATLEVLDLGRNALTSLPPDLGRLTKLRVLFCSNNPFIRLPPVLGDCTALSQVGFRGCGLVEIPTESLPPSVRWLTLTDNAITVLPPAIGERPLLQKLMVAGNRLRDLPETLAGASNLELLRLSANVFTALPPWLTDLPRLAWLAWAGNPFEPRSLTREPPRVHWSDLRTEALLGEGASGRIYRALWRTGEAEPRPTALKLYKGAMTSDGLPTSEMAACLAAGDHPNLVGGLGRLIGHPDGLEGLLMPLLPSEALVLAGPPSLESCSRDVYPPDVRFEPGIALTIARGIAAAMAHLHARGLSHGDLYAHNILWDPTRSAAMLSDFGAASVMPRDQAPALQRLDVLAFGLLLGELLDRTAASDVARELQRDCMRSDPASRPSMAEAMVMLDTIPG